VARSIPRLTRLGDVLAVPFRDLIGALLVPECTKSIAKKELSGLPRRNFGKMHPLFIVLSR
jgi:hypothetical protein